MQRRTAGEEAVSGRAPLSGEEEAGSPAFHIPAVKATSRRPTVDLQAWPAALALAPVEGRRPSICGSSDGGSSVSMLVEPPPAWQLAWHGLRRAAGWLVRTAASVVTQPATAASTRVSKLLAPRTQSMEVLALGREASAPYLPDKRCLSQLQRQQQQLGVSSGAVLDAKGGPAGRSAAAQRWHQACRAVLDGREVLACMDLLANRLASPEDRLHAAFVLRMRLEGYPRPERLAWALLARRGPSRLPWGDHVMNELFVTGECIFSFFSRPPMGAHFPYVTLLLLVVLVLVFFFMAGQYSQYEAVANPATTACLAALRRNGTSAVWGPGGMVQWIKPRKSVWCYPGSAGKFDATFLIEWGARWAPKMRTGPQRWLTSALLHQTFMHLLSNSVLLVGLAGQMEIKHGSWRIAVVGVLSALGGNLFSAVTEAPCVAVVGASGVVFGFAGCTVADTIHNFETLTRPLLRTLVMLAFLVFFAVTIGTTAAGTSHMSHVGGFIVGLLASLVMLRNPHRGRAELAWTAGAAAGCMVLFSLLPCYFYLIQFPKVCCGC